MSRKANLSALLSGKKQAIVDPKVGVVDDELTAVKTGAASAPDVELTAVKQPPDWSRPRSPSVRSGAVRGMEASLRGLADAANRIEHGSAVAELDPGLLDASMVSDRIADTGDPTLAILVESLRERGQQVPILVRPHPSQAGRYQIAYGHRRARAAAVLGQSVRAVIRVLTDDELVVAQGKENLERRDLSYIERSLFAARMEDLGFSRDTICAAMAADETEVSRYVVIARAVPEFVIAAIGPAPKVGRPRWLALTERIKSCGAELAEARIAEPGFGDRPTDERFAAVLEALAAKGHAKVPKNRVWKDSSGRKVARVEETADRFSLSIDRKIEPDFGAYLFDHLSEILAAFKAGKV